MQNNAKIMQKKCKKKCAKKCKIMQKNNAKIMQNHLRKFFLIYNNKYYNQSW